MYKMEPLGIALIGGVLIFVFGRLFVRNWLIRRYLNRQITTRMAVALLALVSVVPYVVLITVTIAAADARALVR
jgi:apolipoprotein N-acyltransferase